LKPFPFKVSKAVGCYNTVQNEIADPDWKKAVEYLENQIISDPFRDGVVVVFGNYDTDGTRLVYTAFFSNTIQKKLGIVYSVINATIMIEDIVKNIPAI